MAITKQRKDTLVEEYVDLLGDSSALVFIQAQGLTVAEVTNLRGKIRDVGGSYSVVKNTLFRLALTRSDLPTPDVIKGPIAVVFCPEDVAPVVKAVQDFGRVMEDRTFRIVGGIVEKNAINANQADALATMPTKEALFAQILGGINAPGSQLVGTVASGIRQVLNVLQARVDQLKEDGAAA